MTHMDKRLIFTTSAEIVRVPPESVVFIVADGNYKKTRKTDTMLKLEP